MPGSAAELGVLRLDPGGSVTKAQGRTSIDEAVAYRVHQTNRLLLTHLGRFLDSHNGDLSPEKYFIVSKLGQAGPMAQNELVEVALDDGPNVSRLVERLVKAGLVERTENPNDRRARVLDLTADGRTLAARIESGVVEERQRVFNGISDEDLKTFNSVLDQINANVRPSLETPIASSTRSTSS